MIFMIPFSCIFVVTGLIATILGIKELSECSVKTRGRVVDIHVGGPTTLRQASVQGYNYSSGASKFPVIEYNGGMIATPHFGSTDLPYKIGDEVTIYYNPKDPSKITLGRKSITLVVGGVMLIIGLIMLIVTILVGVLFH